MAFLENPILAISATLSGEQQLQYGIVMTNTNPQNKEFMSYWLQRTRSERFRLYEKMRQPYKRLQFQARPVGPGGTPVAIGKAVLPDFSSLFAQMYLVYNVDNFRDGKLATLMRAVMPSANLPSYNGACVSLALKVREGYTSTGAYSAVNDNVIASILDKTASGSVIQRPQTFAELARNLQFCLRGQDARMQRMIWCDILSQGGIKYLPVQGVVQSAAEQMRSSQDASVFSTAPEAKDASKPVPLEVKDASKPQQDGNARRTADERERIRTEAAAREKIRADADEAKRLRINAADRANLAKARADNAKRLADADAAEEERLRIHAADRAKLAKARADNAQRLADEEAAEAQLILDTELKAMHLVITSLRERVLALNYVLPGKSLLLLDTLITYSTKFRGLPDFKWSKALDHLTANVNDTLLFNAFTTIRGKIQRLRLDSSKNARILDAYGAELTTLRNEIEQNRKDLPEVKKPVQTITQVANAIAQNNYGCRAQIKEKTQSKVGKVLGKGAYGCVYSLISNEGIPETRVLKIVDQSDAVGEGRTKERRLESKEVFYLRTLSEADPPISPRLYENFQCNIEPKKSLTGSGQPECMPESADGKGLVMVLERYTDNVRHLFNNQGRYLTVSQLDKLIQITLMLTSRGVIHGDLKLDNVLWRLVDDRKTHGLTHEFVFTDFGFTGDYVNYNPREGYTQYLYSDPYAVKNAWMLELENKDEQERLLRVFNIWQLEVELVSHESRSTLIQWNDPSYGMRKSRFARFSPDLLSDEDRAWCLTRNGALQLTESSIKFLNLPEPTRWIGQGTRRIGVIVA